MGPFRDVVGDEYVRDVLVEYRLGSGVRVSACTSPGPSGPMSRSTVVCADPEITKRRAEAPTASGDGSMYVSGGCPPDLRRLSRRSRRRLRTAYDLEPLPLRGM